MHLTCMDDDIISFCATEQERHPKARYWLPDSNERRLDIYMKLNKLTVINTPKHIAKLVAGGILQEVKPRD